MHFPVVPKSSTIIIPTFIVRNNHMLYKNRTKAFGGGKKPLFIPTLILNVTPAQEQGYQMLPPQVLTDPVTESIFYLIIQGQIHPKRCSKYINPF